MVDLPIDVNAPITVTSPAAMPPFIMALSEPKDLGSGVTSSVPRLRNLSHTPVSLRLTTPSGLKALASHQHRVNSRTLLALSMSPASFSGSVQTLALRGENRGKTACAALVPASSVSKHITTLSNVSRYSRLALMSLTAAAAPDLMDTAGHLPSNISLTARASSSPSVIVMYLPPAANDC